MHRAHMTPGDDPHPHTRDGVEAGRLVERLGCDDCRDLYGRVKTMPRQEANSLVQRYVAR